MKAVAYFRVSTAKQGASGLGLEAQRDAIRRFLGNDYPPIKEFTEIESGKRSDRRQLDAAIKYAKLHKATLVIAKLDRLTRNVHFLSGLMESGVDFQAADNPRATPLTIHILSAVAEDETRRISERTKAALAAAKARGTKLGGFRGAKVTPAIRALGTAALRTKARENAETIAPVIAEIEAAGASSLRAVASALNERGLTTPRGKQWTAMAVRNTKLQLARAA